MGRNTFKLAKLVSGAFVASVLAASGNVVAGSADLAVVVNSKNGTTKLSRGELRRIFQTAKTTWDSGGNITAVNLPESNDMRQAFDRAVLGLDKDDVAKFWSDRKIRGGARPPRKAPSTSAVAKLVEEDVGAIGYVKAEEVKAPLRKVATIRGSDVM